MNRLRVSLVAGLAVLLAAVPAAATEQRVISQPNGDFAVFALIRSDTDKDRDGNKETATQPDTVFVILDVCRRFDEEQIVEVTRTFDRPGTEFDEQVTTTADLVTFSCVGGGLSEKVSKKWGSGLYTVTIEATNTSGDTATASASITID